MKKTLLSSSAIAGAALLAAPVATPAFAGTPSVGDSFEVTIGGNMRFTAFAFEQDVRAGRGRGYRFATDESEIKFAAGGVADNGLEYGFELELQTQTNDGNNADETWGYLRGNWGEINLGDQDGAADRMAIGGEDAMPGRGGYDGGMGDVANLGNRFNGPGADFTGDATKVTYFTPRVFGFQLGGSWTPDSGHAGGAGIDDDGVAGGAAVEYENIASGGINYVEEFGGFGVILAATVEWADEAEYVGLGGAPLLAGANPAIAGSADDAWQWQFGGKVTYAGFELGGAWGGGHNRHANLITVAGATSTNIQDSGQWADVGLKYGTGPWTVGGGAFWSWAENNAGGFSGPDTEVFIWSVGGNYQVAPGMALATDVNFFDVDNRTGAIPGLGGAVVNNDGTVFVFSTIFSF